jgi:2-polyprenyl-6-methoxyphenol hydroxylase-like FAD-dependent oxidoreductase
MVQEKLVQDQWDIAADLFPAVAQQLVFATQEPFLQPVYEFATQHMVFDRVCLLGNAAFLPRPHTAASTAQAVANAADLATALHASPDNWTAVLSSWETTQIQLGVSLQQLGTSLGNQSQFGTWQGQQLTFGDTLQTLRSPGRPQGTSTH